MNIRIGLALSLAVLASSCAWRDIWRHYAERQCDRDYPPGPERIDCYQRVSQPSRRE
jgi:hypothetical protein